MRGRNLLGSQTVTDTAQLTIVLHALSLVIVFVKLNDVDTQGLEGSLDPLQVLGNPLGLVFARRRGTARLAWGSCKVKS